MGVVGCPQPAWVPLVVLSRCDSIGVLALVTSEARDARPDLLSYLFVRLNAHLHHCLLALVQTAIRRSPANVNQPLRPLFCLQDISKASS